MTRDEFTAGLLQRLRNVRQKEERLRLAEEMLRVYGPTRDRELARADARNNLEAAEIQFAEFVYGVVPMNEPAETLK